MWKKIMVIVLLVPVLYIAVVLIHGTVADVQPAAVSSVEVLSEGNTAEIQDSVLSFAIWNLGYAGLGEESDFFYEKSSLFSGKRMVRPPRDISQKNWAGIQNQIKNTQTDFWLLQEVDIAAKRSYFVDQMVGIQDLLPNHYASFAANYEVARVPVPVLEPWQAYGKVESGLGTFTKYQPLEAQRLQLPGNYSWPTRIFMLDRCAAIHRFAHANGKEVVVINIHNSAYDDGRLKAQQMDYLKELFQQEYEKGNYVIAGGDWNQCPPFFPFDRFMPGRGGDYVQQNVDSEMMPTNWKWIYDPTVPTNRKVTDPFEKGNTFVTLIDFFLISPNIRVKRARGIDLNFQFSDHQPVWMQVELL
ncbi:MAG TPA: endonuclease/exonuclease/phosphatase family protein [Saprospiraceae bacterium]|nr:endonuclease/exonuclease/phosphatase family protein [Saprospiraceae bacterium]